jgi:HPt (histidine-containing phosphotransfer) domain-containing protein
MDDDELLHAVAECFLGDIPQQIEALRGCLESRDIPSTERLAHTIKGAAANVGGERLRELAKSIEMAAAAGDIACAVALMPELEKLFAQLKDAMTIELA